MRCIIAHGKSENDTVLLNQDDKRVRQTASVADSMYGFTKERANR